MHTFTAPEKSPNGTCNSPITAESITKGANSVIDPVTSEIYHLGSRPSEKGRNIVVHMSTITDVVSQVWKVAPTADKTIPEPTDDVTTILARFADAGFSPAEAITLLSSRTVAAATPFTFDTLEVLRKSTLLPGVGHELGKVFSPMFGEMHLQSDACLWQAIVDSQDFMVSSFAAIMAKLQALGQDTTQFIDCSDVVPVPQVLANEMIQFSPSFGPADLELKCLSLTFPSLATFSGPVPTVPPVPGS